jgi:dihydroflavonol-4-reductase
VEATTVFLTGGTGIIGSNIATLLVHQGHGVRALVRSTTEAEPLAQLGVTLVQGDVTDSESVTRAADGAEYAIHSAALLGGAVQDRSQFDAVNVIGSANVFDSAKKVGIKRTAYISTVTCLDVNETLTESSPLSSSDSLDPYSETKRRTYLEALGRVETGEDICFIASGPAYGPSPMPERSMVAPSWNQRMVAAIEGELLEYVTMPLPFVLARDVAIASISSLEKGRIGERYLAIGRPQDVMSMPSFCNKACEVAGSDAHVREIRSDELDEPALLARLGPSIIELAKQRYADPFVRNELTVERLGYHPASLDEGLNLTIPWLRDHGLLAKSV